MSLSNPRESQRPESHRWVEEVEVAGHIIDSLILPKVLDCITAAGAEFRIKRITIGQARSDPSYALVEVSAGSSARLQEVLEQIHDHGAVPTHTSDARLALADCSGAFPEGFYSTTNQRTQVRISGEWIEVHDQEMDCGIMMDPSSRLPRCIPMTDVKVSDQIVIGHAGVRVFPPDRDAVQGSFEFMNSAVSTEKPKGLAIRAIARQMIETRAAGGKILVVGGPAIVHTGSVGHFCELIRRGFVQRLFAGNALATHDIEHDMFGTSLGIDLGRGSGVAHGHEHHLRAINRIRRAGGIREAIRAGVLKSGIMFECVQQGVDFLLCGSIRDDGPLTDVITDTLVAQQRMREAIRDVAFCLMIATTLHSIAVGNLLPAWVPVVCIDINPSTLIKLGDRGSFQTVGLVTDVEPFLRELLDEIRLMSSSTSPT